MKKMEEEGIREEGNMEEGIREARKFSIIHIPVFSFFSGKLYKDVGLRWKGVNFGYLLLFLALCWIPTMVRMHVVFAAFVENYAPGYLEQMPEITIRDGELSISEEQPYYIKAPDSNDILAVIDTTGTFNTLEDANALCLVTKNKITWRKSDIETQTMDLSQIAEFDLTRKDVMGWLRMVSKFLAVTIYPGALLGSYVFRILQALIYGVVGLLFGLLFKSALSYGAMVRVAVVAMTPGMVVKTILGMAEVRVPYSGLILLLVTLVYLLFAVKVISEASAVDVESGEGEVFN